MFDNLTPSTVVIFGASGDLTRRKLVPALHSLACDGLLAPETQVVGVARSTLTDEAFRDRVYGGLEAYACLHPGISELWYQFVDRLSYLPGSYDDPGTYQRLSGC